MNYTYASKIDTDAFNKATGKELRKYREKAGYSQNGLSEASGLSQQHISQVELGKRNLGFDQWYSLSLLPNFSLTDVLAKLNTPPATASLATDDDFEVIRQYDSHIAEDQLVSCIRGNQIYLLWTPEQLVGVCRYSLFCQTTPFLEFLHIDESHRRNGYGSTLLEHWENAMKALGYHHVMLSIQENASNRCFYEKCGYHSIGSFLPPDHEATEIIYTKILSEQ